jgi:hypothetical protein
MATDNHYAGPPADEDRDVLRLIAEGQWRHSRQLVDVHEYIGQPEQPELYQAIADKMRGPDTWTASYEAVHPAYPGGRKTMRFRYVRIGAWKYWLSSGGRGRYKMANRGPLPPPPEAYDCDIEVSEPDQQAISAAAYRLEERTGSTWAIFECSRCGEWHATEVPPDE